MHLLCKSDVVHSTGAAWRASGSNATLWGDMVQAEWLIDQRVSLSHWWIWRKYRRLCIPDADACRLYSLIVETQTIRWQACLASHEGERVTQRSSAHGSFFVGALFVRCLKCDPNLTGIWSQKLVVPLSWWSFMHGAQHR